MMDDDMDMIEEMVHRLTCAAHRETSKELEEIDTCELGLVVDMIKDLADARYHHAVVEAMRDDDDDDDDDHEGRAKYSPKALEAMSPDDRIDHIRMDVENTWRMSDNEHRKKLKENLTTWSNKLTM